MSSSGALNTAIANGITSIINIGVKPTASLLLSFFCVAEIYRLWSKADSHGMSGSSTLYYTLTITLVKMSIAVMLIRSCDRIMWAIYTLSDNIMKGVNSINISAGTMSSISFAQIKAMLDSQNMSFFDILLTQIEIAPANLIVNFCGVVVSILFIGRMMEIYVLVALSPVALITFVHDEFSQVGKTFLKQFVAVCLQGAVMLITLKVFSVILGVAVIGGGNAGEIAWNCIQYGILLCICIFSSSKWAKYISGAV